MNTTLDQNTTTGSVTEGHQSKILISGYDLPVYGLDNGQFYYIHIPAMICIAFSFISVVIIIVASFRQQSYRTFFSWTKSERFVVYLAVCDGLFNIAHTMDHAHIAITRNHVHPRQLCEFYGFMLAEFVMAQNLMVNIVAINAFTLIYFRKFLNFGKYDWKLILWTFGAPFTGAIIAVSLGQLGPNGTFCFFDGVKGRVANICFTTVPLLIILIMNIILYVSTWLRIRVEVKNLDHALGTQAKSISVHHRAARNMSLFVLAFFIQWWAMALYGTWQLIDEDVPQALFHFVTTFSNIGGILNGIVYIVIRRRKANLKTWERAMSDPKLRSSEGLQHVTRFSNS